MSGRSLLPSAHPLPGLSLRMQTFLPYPDFAKSASVLDNKRLGKQRVEAKQIYLALTDATYGWQNHPAVRMWRGFEFALCHYGVEICREWRRRGFKDTLYEFFWPRDWAINSEYYPDWLGSSDFHASHRSNLLRKDPIWYGQFGWTEGPDLPYVWPTNVSTLIKS